MNRRKFRRYRTYNGGGAKLAGLKWTVMRSISERLLFCLRELPQYAWVLVNGELVGEHRGDFSLVNGFSFQEFLLPEDFRMQPLAL